MSSTVNSHGPQSPSNGGAKNLRVYTDSGGVSPLTPPESVLTRRFLAPPFAGDWGPWLFSVLIVYSSTEGGGNNIKCKECVNRKGRTEED